jgi:predicted ATP-binding protein involved in virulence
MSKTVFHKIKVKNFLSTGNSSLEYQLDQNNHTLIVGGNGYGKCCHSETLVDINISDPQILKLFKEHLINENTKKNSTG